jgi:hypothetical protein
MAMTVSEIRLLVADDQRNVRGNRHRRAFDALNKGDWRTYGAEMDALKKALQGGKVGPAG